jgi:hypothetical protein
MLQARIYSVILLIARIMETWGIETLTKSPPPYSLDGEEFHHSASRSVLRLKGDFVAFIRDVRHIAAVPDEFRGDLIWLYEPLEPNLSIERLGAHCWFLSTEAISSRGAKELIG